MYRLKFSPLSDVIPTAVHSQKSRTPKFSAPRDKDCGAILDAEHDAGLTPCKSDKFKSARRIAFWAFSDASVMVKLKNTKL